MLKIKQIGLAFFGATVMLAGAMGDRAQAKTVSQDLVSQKPAVTLVKFKKRHRIKKHHGIKKHHPLKKHRGSKKRRAVKKHHVFKKHHAFKKYHGIKKHYGHF